MTLTRRVFMGALALLPFPAFFKAKSEKSLLWHAERLVWGTYGKSGKEPLKYVRLGDRDGDHLRAILTTESWHIGRNYLTAIHMILADRAFRQSETSLMDEIPDFSSFAVCQRYQDIAYRFSKHFLKGNK